MEEEGGTTTPVSLPRRVLLPQTKGAGQGVPPPLPHAPAVQWGGAEHGAAGPGAPGAPAPCSPLLPRALYPPPGTCTHPGRAGVCSPTRGGGCPDTHGPPRVKGHFALAGAPGSGYRGVPGMPRFGEGVRAGQHCGLSARGCPRRRRFPRWDEVPTRVSPQQQRQHRGAGPGAGARPAPRAPPPAGK